MCDSTTEEVYEHFVSVVSLKYHALISEKVQVCSVCLFDSHPHESDLSDYNLGILGPRLMIGNLYDNAIRDGPRQWSQLLCSNLGDSGRLPRSHSRVSAIKVALLQATQVGTTPP